MAKVIEGRVISLTQEGAWIGVDDEKQVFVQFTAADSSFWAVGHHVQAGVLKQGVQEQARVVKNFTTGQEASTFLSTGPVSFRQALGVVLTSPQDWKVLFCMCVPVLNVLFGLALLPGMFTDLRSEGVIGRGLQRMFVFVPLLILGGGVLFSGVGEGPLVLLFFGGIPLAYLAGRATFIEAICNREHAERTALIAAFTTRAGSPVLQGGEG